MAFNKAIQGCRIKCLTEDEKYWIDDNESACEQPIGPRNEAAALSMLVSRAHELCGEDANRRTELHGLCDSYCTRVGSHSEAGPSGRPFPDDSSEMKLTRWCKQQGMQACASPALFGGDGGSDGLRGLMADRDIAPGDTIISVPQDSLISYRTAKESDLGKALARIPGLSDDSLALIWTMVERQDPEAQHAPYWTSLPQAFNTGLSTSEASLGSLQGWPVHAEALAARKHMREQFEALQPVFQTLVRAYPDYMKPHFFTFEAFLWAAELWYAYAIQVQFADGSMQACLVPYVGLLNHSPYPHAVHFSRVDPDTKTLGVRVFRSCPAGAQLFISYGPLTNSKLMLFYGFAIEGNPFDTLDITLNPKAGGKLHVSSQHRSLIKAAGLAWEHQLRAVGPLSPKLLAALRVLAASPDELARLSKRAGKGGKGSSKRVMIAELQKPLSVATERAVVALLQQLLAALGPKQQRQKQQQQQQPGADAQEQASTCSGSSGQAQQEPLLVHVATVVSGLQRVREHVRGLCDQWSA